MGVVPQLRSGNDPHLRVSDTYRLSLARGWATRSQVPRRSLGHSRFEEIPWRDLAPHDAVKSTWSGEAICRIGGIPPFCVTASWGEHSSMWISLRDGCRDRLMAARLWLTMGGVIGNGRGNRGMGGVIGNGNGRPEVIGHDKGWRITRMRHPVLSRPDPREGATRGGKWSRSMKKGIARKVCRRDPPGVVLT